MSRLRVAVVHYHLKRGGVTRVIESTVDSLQDDHSSAAEFLVIAGEVPQAFKYRDRAVQLDGLSYSNLQPDTPDPEQLLDAIQRAARSHFGGDPDLWHIHNHSLGKNCSMPGMVSLLVQTGAPVLLHMHDFAEDGRPENYRLNKVNRQHVDALYPDAENAHYGFINSRDRDIFHRAGIPSQRLHYLGNPVGGQAKAANPAVLNEIRDKLNASRLFLYPVRAVRRKNFGEMLLWSALAPAGDVFATTLGPTNPDYVPRFREWTAFAEDMGLPVHFSIGETSDWAFSDIVHAADYVLTTSIAEGFGLTFLEPFLFGKLILGRNLPDVTIDFKQTNLPTGHLYKQLPIPADWVNQDELAQCIRSELLATYQAYQTTPPSGFVEQALCGITTGDGDIDFGGLNESLQQSIIRRIIKDPGSRKFLKVPDLVPEQVPGYEGVDLDAFSLDSYAHKILETYGSVVSSGSQFAGFFDPDAILKEYLKPERFRLLRT